MLTVLSIVHNLGAWYSSGGEAGFGISILRIHRVPKEEMHRCSSVDIIAIATKNYLQKIVYCVLSSMSPGTVISPKSPKGFFRLEPIQSHSSSGEARLSLNHVADKDPFVAETKRPWVSRRKSRRAEPPWKKFVTVFRVAPQVPIPFDNASSIEPESPTVQFGNFEMENQSMASSSFVDFLSRNNRLACVDE